MYYKLDVLNRKINTISSIGIEEESDHLIKNNYRKILLSDLQAFTAHKEKLPGHSFLIGSSNIYNTSLEEMLPQLTKKLVSIIIFLPIPVIANSNQYHDSAVKQLNNFIFSTAFKNIFGYTQPISALPATVSAGQ